MWRSVSSRVGRKKTERKMATYRPPYTLVLAWNWLELEFDDFYGFGGAGLEGGLFGGALGFCR
jgi:hypothetical protein